MGKNFIKRESSLLYKVYKLELEMLEGDNNQPVGILLGLVKLRKCYVNLALHICGITKVLLDCNYSKQYSDYMIIIYKVDIVA